MTGKEIVKAALASNAWSQKKLADEIGKTQSDITGYLNRGNGDIRLNYFVELLEAMGYKVVIQDKKDDSTKWRVKYDNNKGE